jgi:hypothetical protein
MAAGEDFVLERFALRLLLRALLAVLLVAAAAYPVDWAIWRSRVALSKDGSGGMDQVQVDRFTVAELKGGKEDYYPNGTELMPCSRSLYPQGGNSACWWLRRHREVIQRY